MFHIIYGLVCRKNSVGNEVYRIVEKVENHYSGYNVKIIFYSAIHLVIIVIFANLLVYYFIL